MAEGRRVHLFEIGQGLCAPHQLERDGQGPRADDHQLGIGQRGHRGLHQTVVGRLEREHRARRAAPRYLFESLSYRVAFDEGAGGSEVGPRQHVTKAALGAEVRHARRLLESAPRCADGRKDRSQGLGRQVAARGGLQGREGLAIGGVERGLALPASPDVFRGARSGLEALQNLAIQPRYLLAELRRAASRIHGQLLAAPVLDEPPEDELPDEVEELLAVEVELAGLLSVELAGLLSVELAEELSAFFAPPPLLLYRSAYQPPPFRMKPAPPDTWRLAVA